MTIVRPSTESRRAGHAGDLCPSCPATASATIDPEPLHDEDIKRRRKNMLKRRLPHLVAERGGT